MICLNLWPSWNWVSCGESQFFSCFSHRTHFDGFLVCCERAIQQLNGVKKHSAAITLMLNHNLTGLVFKRRRKSPWVPTLTRPFPDNQANAGSWLCTKNDLYCCAQSAKYKLELTTDIHACIDHTFVNIRECKMPRQLTATKTSHEKWGGGGGYRGVGARENSGREGYGRQEKKGRKSEISTMAGSGKEIQKGKPSLFVTAYIQSKKRTQQCFLTSINVLQGLKQNFIREKSQKTKIGTRD